MPTSGLVLVAVRATPAASASCWSHLGLIQGETLGLLRRRCHLRNRRSEVRILSGAPRSKPACGARSRSASGLSRSGAAEPRALLVGPVTPCRPLCAVGECSANAAHGLRWSTASAPRRTYPMASSHWTVRRIAGGRRASACPHARSTERSNRVLRIERPARKRRVRARERDRRRARSGRSPGATEPALPLSQSLAEASAIEPWPAWLDVVPSEPAPDAV
jgi:hypothetical protein